MGKLDDLVLQIIKMLWTFVCLDVNKVKQTLQTIDLRTRGLLYYMVQFE